MENGVRHVLDSLERDLVKRIEAKRAEIAPLEAELADVRRALAAVCADNSATSLVNKHQTPSDEAAEDSPYKGLTMKELVVRALKEHLREGATSADFLRVFHEIYGRRDIVRTSLSPQLSRLKRERVLTLEGKVWKLVKNQQEDTVAQQQASEQQARRLLLLGST